MRNKELDRLKDEINARADIIACCCGIDISGKMFKCPSGTHDDKKPSAHYHEGKIKCFTCGIGWDGVAMLQHFKGLTFNEALKYGAEQLGLETAFKDVLGGGDVKSTLPKARTPKKAVKTAPTLKEVQRIQKGESNMNEPTENSFKTTLEDIQEIKRSTSAGIDCDKGAVYLAKRGLKWDTAFVAGVYEKVDFLHPTTAKQYPGLTGCPALLFPLDTIEGVTVGYIARWSTDQHPPSIKKTQRVTVEGYKGFFNIKALLQTKAPVFVTEGEMDTLTFLDAGYQAVSMGSASGVSSFVSILTEIAEENKTLPKLILSLDNDEAGRKALEGLEKALKENSIEYSVLPPFGSFKDANEAYMNDRSLFIRTVSGAVENYEPSTEALSDTLSRLFNKPSLPPLSTGFANLDKVLNGGLRAGGLAVLFANPATGKTTFALQIADTIAKGGKDYLFFSLEMTKKELVCKSLSRESIVLALNGYQDKYYPKRGPVTIEHLRDRAHHIDANALSQHYFSETFVRGMESHKARVAEACINSYLQKVESRATICSGMFDVTIQRIKRELDSYKARNGKYPSLCVVDYAQIIAPPEGDNAPKTDKQITDYNIKELKKLAGAYQVPFLVIASVNRESYKSGNGKNEGLTIASAKESGGIEFTADVILGLEGEPLKNLKADPKKTKDEKSIIFSRIIRCKILKNRYGTTGVVYFDYKPKFHFFRMVEVKALAEIASNVSGFYYKGLPIEELPIENQQELKNIYN